MKIDLEKLKELAKDATPGPWDIVMLDMGSYYGPPQYGIRQVQQVYEGENNPNHKFVSTFNPTFILKLIELIEVYEESIKETHYDIKIKHALSERKRILGE